jgi:hypothetical protein
MTKLFLFLLIFNPFFLIGGGRALDAELSEQLYFEWFCQRIAKVESNGSHWHRGRVLIGPGEHKCIGENQIHPQNAIFFSRLTGVNFNPYNLADNRTLRDLYIIFLRNRGMDWWEVAAAYYSGWNYRTINSNYVTDVLGHDKWLHGKEILYQYRGPYGRTFIKLKGE